MLDGRQACGLTMVERTSVSLLKVSDLADIVSTAAQGRSDEPFTGVIVGAFRGGDTAYASTGSADESGGSPSPTTLFRVASISKVFTGLALAVAVHRGEVGLDEAAQQYLPDGIRLPKYADVAITVGQLATHTSGLPRDPAPRGWNTVEALADELSAMQLLGPPGSSYLYSNLGVSVLGLLLGEVSATSYPSLISKRVGEPLSLVDTVLHPASSQLKRLAAGQDENGRVTDPPTSPLVGPAGGFYSTATDLIRFLQAHVYGSPASELASAAALAMQTHFAPLAGPSVGLCWHHSSLPCGEIASWHNGGLPGYAGYVGIVPAAAAGVVVLTNRDVSVDDIGIHALNQLAGLRRV
jgi:D-alanyl-D-alanine-carboxypeptidase/D-alanyl-D-alanine-endopeptidase